MNKQKIANELLKIAKELVATNFNDAFKTVKNIIKKINWKRKKHQGVVDVTEHIDFQEIAENADLTEREYDKLIDLS